MDATISDTDPASPWHAGEVALQTSVGAEARLALMGQRIIRDHMMAQHRAFYPLLPYVVLGSVDAAGDVWATVRAGAPGFLTAPDPSHLAVAVPVDRDDPADLGLADGSPVGLLGIDLATRRRNRLNGTVRRTGPGGFVIEVEQSFGNCPQYIHPRANTSVRPLDRPPSVAATVSNTWDERARAIVAGADTFFVATYAKSAAGHRQVDVSHRGGRPGFVRIGPDGVLTIPDYAGNQFFNTLGNIKATSRAGLAFVDFSKGDMLHMTGTAELVLEAHDLAAFPGAERLWRFRPTTIVFRPDALPLRFSPLTTARAIDLTAPGARE